VAVAEVVQALGQLFVALGNLLWELLTDAGTRRLLVPWMLLIAWLAWWLFAVNWRRAWVVLAEGAWAPVVLLMVLAARVWASLAPSDWNVFGVATLGNFWWQLGGVTLLVGLTLFCGWLQTAFDWGPPEISLEPPAHAAPVHGDAHH
jgi:hypothetical protein